MNASTVLLIVVIAAVFYLILAYNKLVRLKIRAEEGESDIEVQLKRRHDLIPNVIETVKGYAKHEKGVFEKVTIARTQAMSSQGMEQKAKNENFLAGTLKTLFAVAENYPELKANANFLELQRELSDTEDKIQAARRFYNTVVRDLNTAVDSFPTNMIAGMFHFIKREFFDLEEEAAKQPPKVDFEK